MACPPGPNQLAVVERWPIVEVSLYAMHIIKCKILNDFLFFPPLPRYICTNSISSAFCFARVLDHPVRSTTELHFSITSVLIRSVLIWKNRLWKFTLLGLWMVVDGVITNYLKQKKQKIPKLIKNTQTKTQNLTNDIFSNTRMKGFSYYPQFRFTCCGALVHNFLTEGIFWFSLTPEGRGLQLRNMHQIVWRWNWKWLIVTDLQENCLKRKLMFSI